MLMEAVLESLKDLEVQNPKAEQPPASSVSNVSVEPLDKDDSHEISKPIETESSLVKLIPDSKSKTISTTSETSVPLKAESTTISVSHSQNLASVPSPVEGALPPPQRLDTSSVTESSNTSGSARSDSSATASLQSSSDADISHNTKATVTVVRNPAGNVMDGLMRRWDFNFFKNNNR